MRASWESVFRLQRELVESYPGAIVPFVALEGSSKMQVLRGKARRAARAFAEAIPDIDEVDARNLQRCCDLLMIHDDRVPPDRQQAEAYDLSRGPKPS